RLRCRAHLDGARLADVPAQATAPFDELAPGQLQLRGRRGNRDAPERALGPEEREPVLGELVPERVRQLGRERGCAVAVDETVHGRLDGGLRTGEADDQLAVAPAGRRER